MSEFQRIKAIMDKPTEDFNTLAKPAEALRTLAERDNNGGGVASSAGVRDARQLRTEYIGATLAQGYEQTSRLKLKDGEAKRLREDFGDEHIEVRPHDGIIYISHMALRERLWDVFGPGQVSEVCRDRFMRSDSNEVGVDLVLMIRGVAVADAIGTAKYFPNNPKGSYGDTVESAWSDALRRCCKKFGVGTQVWRMSFIRDFKARYGKIQNKPLKFTKTRRQTDPAIEAERWAEPIEGHKEKRETAMPESDDEL